MYSTIYFIYIAYIYNTGGYIFSMSYYNFKWSVFQDQMVMDGRPTSFIDIPKI